MLKTLFFSFPRRTRLALSLLVFHLVLFTLFRLFFLGVFLPLTPTPDGGEMAMAFYLGLKFDLRLTLLMLLPVLVLGWVPGLNLVTDARARKIWAGVLSLGVLGAVVLYLLDAGHYAYLQSRINSTVLVFLQTPDISAQMAWETYPIIWATLGVGLFVAVYFWVITRFFLPLLDGPAPDFKSVFRWKKITLGFVLGFLVIFGLYGKMAYYPLRWNEAFFSNHPLVIAAGLNPVLYFFDSLSITPLDFDEKAVREHYDEVADFLAVKNKNKEALAFTRREKPAGLVRGKPNVVVIFLESFAAHKVGAFGNTLSPTTHFDALAEKGFLFKEFYTPSTGTARSIFASLFGIPDVNQETTSSRNPMVVDQHTIVSAFKDYEKLYFIGGSSNWRNIGAMLRKNIPGLKIYEEGDYTSPRTDVWGLSDLHLFEEANRVLAQPREKPFFAFIQTAGNHRPYTIPEDNRGFELKDPGISDLNPLGFYSVDEYNSFRFLDHSLGVYIAQAKKEAYYRDTVFFLWGDHGLPGHANHFPPGMAEHQLLAHRVPFLVVGPGIPRGQSHTLVSELDAMPTIASVMGQPYVATTLGRDMFDARLRNKRGVFVINMFQKPPPFGILNKKFFLKIKPGEEPRLYQYLSSEPGKDVQQAFPEETAKMARLARGLFETSRYMLYHNTAKAAQMEGQR